MALTGICVSTMYSHLFEDRRTFSAFASPKRHVRMLNPHSNCLHLQHGMQHFIANGICSLATGFEKSGHMTVHRRKFGHHYQSRLAKSTSMSNLKLGMPKTNLVRNVTSKILATVIAIESVVIIIA